MYTVITMLLRSWRRSRKCEFFLLFVAFTAFIILQISLSHDHDVGKTELKILSRDGRRLFESDIRKEQVPDILNLPPTDSRLLQQVRYMIKAPELNVTYNLTRPSSKDFSRGQSLEIDRYLRSKKHGYFIEIGATDGERHSVSLFFEKYREWEGLLIEPDPKRHRQLREKGRKASTLQACVRSNATGSNSYFEDGEGHVTVPCFWMETILAVLDRQTIDLLSVDARDQEIEILKSIPLQKYDINLITVEFSEGTHTDPDVLKYLLEHGYTANHQFVNHPLHKNDLLFSKKKKKS